MAHEEIASLDVGPGQGRCWTGAVRLSAQEEKRAAIVEFREFCDDSNKAVTRRHEPPLKPFEEP